MPVKIVVPDVPTGAEGHLVRAISSLSTHSLKTYDFASGKVRVLVPRQATVDEIGRTT
jgi:hypothetical protein